MIVVSPLADNYARALFNAALAAGALDQVATDIERLIKVRTENPGLVTFLRAPNISTAEKEAFLERVLKAQVHPLLYNFVRMLLRRGRLPLFLQSKEGFKLLYRRHKNLAAATVASAVPLSDEQKQRLNAELTRRTGKTFETEYVVDPTLIGGVRFKSGDTLLDTTLSRALVKLRSALENVRVI